MCRNTLKLHSLLDSFLVDFQQEIDCPKLTEFTNLSKCYCESNIFLCFIPATRETAFLHAISSAAITHELTLQCRLNKIPGCKCGKTRKQPKANSGWQWGGCSDDIKFGEKETKRFIDKLEKGNDARAAFNLHNNEIGREVTAIFLFSFLH